MANVSAQLKAARRSVRVGERDEALSLARDALKQNPNSLLAARLLTWLTVEAGSRDAFTYLQQCISIDPEDPLAVVAQAVYAESNGVTEGALQHFVRAAELAPADELIADEIDRLGGEAPDTNLSGGNRCLQQGDADGAIDYLRLAATDRPEDPAVKLALARAFWMQGSIDQAVAQAQQVLATHPQSIVALMIVLASELKRGRALRARDLQAKVDSIDPGCMLHPELGRLLGLPVGR